LLDRFSFLVDPEPFVLRVGVGAQLLAGPSLYFEREFYSWPEREADWQKLGKPGDKVNDLEPAESGPDQP
jgi:hypothetical protein